MFFITEKKFQIITLQNLCCRNLLKNTKAHSGTIDFYELMYLKEDTISHITQLKSNSLQLYVQGNRIYNRQSIQLRNNKFKIVGRGSVTTNPFKIS
jgi:hypothetical protein